MNENELPCTQAWRGDDDGLHFCNDPRGHQGECSCGVCGLSFSQLVVMI